MRIAIPCARGQLCMHFGHCEQFALVDVDTETKQVRSIEMETPPPHEPGLLPRWLHEKQADLVIAGGMGQRARHLFAQNNIETIVGAPVADPKSLAESWLADRLHCGENVCDH